MDEEWKKTLNIWTNILETIAVIPLRKCEHLFLKLKKINQVKKENLDQNQNQDQEKWWMQIQVFLEALNLQIEVEAPFIHQLEILQEEVWTAFWAKVDKNPKERRKCHQIITNHTTEEWNHF